jgi:hypothetical protein
MRYSLFKVREGRIDQWNAWCDKLNTDLRDAATATIVQEKLVAEAFIVFRLGEEWFTVGMTISEGETSVSADPNLPLNIEHKRNKTECLEFVSSGESAYFLQNPGYRSR